MTRADVERVYELSPMQQAMLFASLYAPGSGVYVIQLSLRLTGRLDVDALERAFQHVAARHGVLRTGFYWEDLEKPVQVVYREAELGIHRETWRGLAEDELEPRLAAWLAADRETGFDLGEPPLSRLALFDLGDGSWHLVWTVHHLLIDGWSLGLLLKELFAGYAALAAGREPALPASRSYREYIAWLQRQDAAEAEAFWRRSLAGFSSPTLMAGGDGRGAAGFRQTKRRSLRLSEADTAALRETGRRHRLTLNTLLQGAWSLVLAQATGADEVVFGGTVAGRPGDLPGADSMVGLFINTLPVRVEVDRQRPLLPWLTGLQERQAEARRFEHAPLFEVQTWSGLPAGAALFDNILVLESYPLEGSLAGLPDLALSRVTTTEQTNYPLNVVVLPGAELSLELIHDTGRFDDAAAMRVLERLAGVLRAFAADPEQRLGDVPLLLAGERHQLLVEWNDTRTAYPREASLPELFAAVATAQPEAPAVIAEDGEMWTYRRLDEASNRLAQYLNIEPGARVGIAMDRSADLLVAVLAIVKAGGAYVPLDPGYPDERLAFMREDTGCEVVLAEVDWEAVAACSAAPLPVRVPAEALAYVIYTSGSTGLPKGVAVPHRAIVRLVRDTGYVSLGPGDRTGHVANISFDAATYEIWGALLTGAAAVVIPREVVLSPAGFAERLRGQRVSTMFLTSALFTRMSLEAPGAFAGMSELLVGGEAVDPVAARAVLADHPPRRLLNGYGPTESTTFAAWHPIREVPAEATNVPIGLPLSNTSLHVLDPQGLPVPAEVEGELFIGGDGLAWGYWNRPELTAERFVPSPWGMGERLYRTGDLVRRRPEGPVEYLGRLDHQVKIRGFRIEPGEIEAVLAGHPEVAQCAVVARRDPEVRLVAYVVSPAAGDDLRAWLQQRLPDYMLPAAFVSLAALPLTENGKLDRKALPAPEEMEGVQESALPSDPVEELLAGIWAEVLGRGRVGVHDDFFALGGHSLLATQVVSRIRGVLGVELPLRALFEEPTVAGLARAARSQLQGERLQAPPLVPVPRDGDLPLSFAQQRLWFIDQLEPGNPGYNVPAGVRLIGDLDVARLARVFAEVVRRHEVLRTTFASRNGQPVQEIRDLVPELPVLDLSGLPMAEREARARELAIAESLHSFNLQTGPLLRLNLLRLSAREHLLLVTLHHVIADGWSMGVLVREVQALYRAFGRGEPSPLPALPVQYADFAVWQREWLAGEVLERQLAFWREALAGSSGVLELPTDRPRPAVLSLRGGERRFALDPELARRIAGLGRREGATPFMILAAGLFALLSRLSGQKDLNLASPIAGRNRIETEGLIGFFVNTLVLRADLGRAEVFLDLLQQVREASLGAYAHQDLPFEKLVDEVQPERDLSRSPLAQVALNVQNMELPPADLEGVHLVPEAPLAQVAKFDLAIILAEDGEGRFAGSVQFSTELYDASTAVRLTRQYAAFLDELTARPEEPLSDLSPLTAGERHQVLLEWNDTAGGFHEGALMHQLFEAQADARPDALAAVWEGIEWSYAELEARANRAASLLESLGVERGTSVGIWMERSLHMLAAVLGVLKAGGTYVPLDAAWPADRVETILARTEAPVLVASRATLPGWEEIRWRLPRLADALCLDLEAPEPEPEPVDVSAVRSLWDLVAERATDRVSAGGFVSSLTGLPFSEAEVDEYRDRVLSLAAPWLRPDARVLEVGCGAGLLLWEMAGRAGHCVGVDPSELTQERNREHARAAGIGNVELPVAFAHEIGGLFPEGSFDLVLMASTVQFFPGPRYLEKVIADALRLLAPGGALLVADVMDARRELPRNETRLRIDEDHFRDLAGDVEVLHRTEGFANELGWRYDVLLRPGKEAVRRKRLWTGWHAAHAPAARPAAVAAPEDVAYVIHTSGSTGTPKGIAVQHAPAANLIGWINATFGVGPGDRLLFVTSLCFDLSVYDVFGVLAAGGTVHVAPEEALRDAQELVRLLRREPVTIWDSAPAALQQLAPLFPRAEDRPLRLVMLSGDWIPVRLPDQVRAAFPRARVMALGGATEATVWSNWFPVGEVDPRWPSIPYGRPITRARYHVLDGGMLPCPIGVPGDLYIGGQCLCVGYAGQPALTAEQFVPDPFAAEPGERLYRTGDRARFFADGNLEFLGRVDHQVKVRGYRIELGEIEISLLRHPGVRETVVTVWEDRLVAYVVPREGKAPDAHGLRAFLGETLPAYMVPAAFVTLEALPVTPNGKLDRGALPAPERVRSADPASVEGMDPLEELLAGVWAEVLGLDRVGVHEDFFDLGGHSLLATQVASRIREMAGVELPLRRLFEAPTISALARAVREGREAASPIVPVSRDHELPLSFAQQRLWFLDQLSPGNPAYNIPAAVRLTGEVSPEELARIFGEVARRHEVLRTTFVARDGRPAQVIHPELRPALPLIDLSGLPDPGREALALAREEARRPFDLESGPLLRLTLVRLGEREHLLLVTFHHIVSDGWSMGVLLREIAALHEAIATSRPPALPQLPVQYADFARWQREWLSGEVLESQISYWRGQLAGAPRLLELPTDRPRPAVQSFRGAALPVTLPAALSAAVQGLCRREGATPFMVLLASWATLLGRHAGQQDVLLGTPIAGRNRRETEGLIGCFVNTLVMRADLSGAPAFSELLARIRQVSLDGYTHQDVPFERLVEELVPDRDLAWSPLFQVLLGLQNTPAGPALSVPGLALTPLAVDSGLTKVDLSINFWEREDRGLDGALRYASDLFDGTTVARLWARYTALLEAAVADPETPVSELPLLLPAERHQAFAEWNDTARAFSGSAALHELVAQQAERTPDAAALSFDGLELTYRELDRRANRLAHHLIAQGVAPEDRVGVMLERSPELIVATLGVLKAGAAWVALDPSYPAERLAVMIESSGARLVLDETWSEIEGPDTAPAVPVDGSQLAYVLFTSGSTGMPKGVMVPHRGIVNRLLWEQEAFRLTPGDRFLHKTPIGFDVSVWEVFWPLTAGACLVIARPEGHRDPAYLADLIARERITTVHFVPSMLQAFLETPGLSGLASVRLLMAGGEALPPELIRRAQARLPGARMYNRYGPTEASVSVSVWPCDPGSKRPVSPIGRPIANLRLRVVDRELRLQPPGVPGELLLGGAGLARGYLDRPDLTAAAFVPNPFGDEPGGRLYRTGDLARLLPDGNVELLGRIDHQVKLRGFRIELGEIEAALASHPEVRECAVLVRDERLVAYVVPPIPPPSAGGFDALRAHLAARLPEYMVPAVFVALESMPLSPNGKVDRRSLPSPDRANTRAGTVPPRTRTEEVLAEIWKELLKLGRVGVEDHFFDLGGHSLLATQVLARVRQAFGVEISLREVFGTPTIAGLAAIVDARTAVPADEDELAALLDQIDVLSDDEARSLLDNLVSEGT